MSWLNTSLSLKSPMKRSPDYFRCLGSEYLGESWALYRHSLYLHVCHRGRYSKGNKRESLLTPRPPASTSSISPELPSLGSPVGVLSNLIFGQKPKASSQERQKGDLNFKTGDHCCLAAPPPLLERQNQQPWVSSSRKFLRDVLSPLTS